MRPAKTLLAAQTGAGNGQEFYVPQMLNATLICFDYQDGAAVELTATKNAVRLYGPALYRPAKDSTSTATGMFLQE